MTDDEKVEEAIKLLSGLQPIKLYRKTSRFLLDTTIWIDIRSRTLYEDMEKIMQNEIKYCKDYEVEVQTGYGNDGIVFPYVIKAWGLKDGKRELVPYGEKFDVDMKPFGIINIKRGI